MLAQAMRLVLALLVVLAIVSTASAGRMDEVSRARGFDPRVINQRAVEEAKLKPKRQPIEKRASSTTAPAPTAA